MTFLTPESRAKLLSDHRNERDGKKRDRIKTILLADDGWTYRNIAKALFIDEQSISRHVQEYKETGNLTLNSGGSVSKLNEEQTTALIVHLKETLYLQVSGICQYVEATYKITYTVAGMTSWLSTHKFVYKKPKGVPAKADPVKQEEHIEKYKKLMNETPEDEPILFGDSMHPTQSSKLTSGWIYKGEEHYLPTTGQRTRVNITGALNLETAHVVHGAYDKICGASFIQFLEKVQNAYPNAPKIHLIVDQGRCHTSKEVKEYLKEKNVRIKLHYLPPYSPNLNPIERLWKIFHEHVSNNKHYPKAKEFVCAVNHFFNETIYHIKDLIKNRCTDNFEILYS